MGLAPVGFRAEGREAFPLIERAALPHSQASLRAVRMGAAAMRASCCPLSVLSVLSRLGPRCPALSHGVSPCLSLCHLFRLFPLAARCGKVCRRCDTERAGPDYAADGQACTSTMRRRVGANAFAFCSACLQGTVFASPFGMRKSGMFCRITM